MIRKNVLERMYLKDYKTVDDIAKRFGVSKFAVGYWIKKHGIRKVERWERYGLNFFNEKQREYLYGSLLGDDHLDMSGKRRYPYLAVTHSSKQKKYVEWKYNVWRQIVASGIKSIIIKVNGNSHSANYFITAAHPEFLNFFNLFYFNGRKIVNRNILDKLTPFSIAVWYMDDGYYKKSRGRAQLSTNSFTYAENAVIKDYFNERWSISSNIGTSDSGSYYIWFNTENTIEFFKIIKDHIMPFFDYKIDINRKLQWKILSEKEKEYIKNNYNIESPELIAHKLNRPLNTIFNTACRLGVTRSRGGRKYYEKNL